MGQGSIRGKGSRRTAAPDLGSGQNPNTPIQLYDIKPNARFSVGDIVIPIDEKGIPFRGVVLGHVAEDCLWVKWPTEIEQAHVEEVMAIYDSKSQGAPDSQVMSTPLAASRGNGRRAGMEILEFSGEGGESGSVTEDDNYDAFDSLPSDQDPRDAIDDSPGSGEEVVTLIDVGSICGDYDRTDLMEGRDASRREAISFGRKKTPLDEIRKQDQFKGKSDHEISLNYNVFRDPVLEKFFRDHGLSEGEIENFATLRDHQLGELRKKYQPKDPNNPLAVNTATYQWGQGTGINYRIRNKSALGQGRTAPVQAPAAATPSPTQPATQGTPAPPPGQPSGGRYQWDPRAAHYWYWPPGVASPVPVRNSNTPAGTHIPPRPAPAAPGVQRAAPGTSATGVFPATAGRASARLGHHSDLVGGLLGMTETATRIRQAGAVASAALDLIQSGDEVDDTVTSAVRNATRDLLDATDHLKRSPNRIARRMASRIEEDYAESLAISLEV